MKKGSGSKRFIFIPLIVAAFLFLISWVVMALWNHLMPVVFGIRTITYWQAMGILVLSKILFGFRCGKPGWGRHFWWHRQLHAKIANMTPEEREKFKEEWKMRAAHWHAHPHYPPPPFDQDWQQPGGHETHPEPQNE